ncbi:hypothetical protein [Pedobacter sp. KACC 23697]|uniref:Lipoprotein n=1 Tax=Pedobacter sp. KACC 23697 TaxID=3149230 RepID=A0AAU7K1L8_9SPHI
MKNIFYCSLLIVALSSCALGVMTTVYSMSKGKLDIPQKETYTVVYQANFDDHLSADVAYTNESGKQAELTEVNGAWKKTVTLKSGSHVQLKTLAVAQKEARGEYKILVDGKVISEYINGQKVKLYF